MQIMERPLSAGIFAELLPGSLAMKFGFPISYLKRMGKDSARMLKLLETNPVSINTDFQAAADLYSLTCHEQDHLNRLISTSYGFLLNHIRCMWVDATAIHVDEQLMKNIPFPLHKATLPKAFSVTDILAELKLREVHGEKNIIRCRGLNECLIGLMDNVTGASFVTALWSLAEGDADEVRFLIGGNLDYPYSSFSINSNFFLTTRHILEMFAWKEQGDNLHRIGYNKQAVENLLLHSQDEYRLPFKLWNQYIGPRSPTIDIYWGKPIPLELYAIADLALWPPFQPPGRLDSKYRWNDIHPARRFISAMVAFKELKLEVSYQLDEGTLDTNFRSLQELLCRRLNWPTPETIAQKWLGFLERYSSWTLIEPECSLRTPNAIIGLKERIMSPARVVLNLIPLTTKGLCRPPIHIYQPSKEYVDIVPVLKPELERMMDLLMLEGMAHMHYKKREMIGTLHPTDREILSVALTKSLTRINNWTQAASDKFQYEYKRYLTV